MISSRSLKYRRSLHVAALAVVASVFVLIWMGGLVTSHGVGMSVPDWPTTYGENMFLFPPNKWVGGIFFEHVHRLLGSLTGLLAILLTLMAWAPSQHPTARRWIGRSTLAGGIITIVMVVFAIAMSSRWSEAVWRPLPHGTTACRHAWPHRSPTAPRGRR